MFSYNNKNFTPVTMAYPYLHDQLCYPITLHQADCPITTPDKIKEKLAGMKTALKIIMNKWERSGNGDGQLSLENNSNEKNKEGTNYIDGDNQRAFLGSSQGFHLLYM